MVSSPYYDGFCEWYPMRWKLGVQYSRLDEVNPKLQILLKKYGLAFDKNWYYKIAGKERYVHRYPHTWQPRKHYEKKHRG